MALDPRYFKFDAKDSGVKGEEQKAVEKQNPRGEETELAKTTLNPRGSTGSKDSNLDAVISDNLKSLFFDGCLNRILDRQWCV